MFVTFLNYLLNSRVDDIIFVILRLGGEFILTIESHFDHHKVFNYFELPYRPIIIPNKTNNYKLVKITKKRKKNSN